VWGFRVIKMKVGWPWLGEDVECVWVMCEYFGVDFFLMVDVNMRWSVDEVIRVVRVLVFFQFVWFEELIIFDDVVGYACIVWEGGLFIVIGENFYMFYEFL